MTDERCICAYHTVGVVSPSANTSTIPQAWPPHQTAHTITNDTIGVVSPSAHTITIPQAWSPHQPIQVQMLTNAVLDNFTCIDHKLISMLQSTALMQMELNAACRLIEYPEIIANRIECRTFIALMFAFALAVDASYIAPTCKQAPF